MAVIGGGNTAMDAVRTAHRLGAEKAYLVYRRSREEMPARVEEIHHAEQEGIELRLLTNPVRILGDENGGCRPRVPADGAGRARRFRAAAAGSGRRLGVRPPACRPSSRRSARSRTPSCSPPRPGSRSGGTARSRSPRRRQTSRPGVFAGGDVARGGATVILAMRDGRRAAAAIHEYLEAGARARTRPAETAAEGCGRLA